MPVAARSHLSLPGSSQMRLKRGSMTGVRVSPFCAAKAPRKVGSQPIHWPFGPVSENGAKPS